MPETGEPAFSFGKGLVPGLRVGLRLACISIRNAEKGSLHPLATLAPFWYHPGPTLVP
jgi:hypothetical protein